MFEWFFEYSTEIYRRGELVLLSEWPPWLLLAVAGAAAAAIIVVLIRRTEIAAASRMAVAALQIAMLALVFIMIMQPALVTRSLKPGENTVALLLDSSESMRYGTTSSRHDAGAALLESIVADNAELDITPHYYALSATAQRVASLSETSPNGQSTQIAKGLLDVLAGARAEPLAAIVLVSDGIDTSGTLTPKALSEIAAFGVPVHSISVGRDTMPEDLEIERIVMPESALPNSAVTARVSLRHDRGGDAHVSVYGDDQLLASQAVALSEQGGTTSVAIDLGVQEAGSRRLSFNVDGGTAEPERRNNHRTASLEVRDRTFRILYYEGEPRWEFKFLRRAVHGGPELELVTLLRVSPNKFYRQGIASAEQLEQGFPSKREELFAFDALIIGSVEAASFTEHQLQLIRDFVSERGGSLLLLAGRNGLGNGGWGQSAVADLMPSRLPPSAEESFVRSMATVNLTPQGADRAMLRLVDAEDSNYAAWEGLPAVADVQALGALKPAATTLLEARTEFGRQPLLITHPFGRGHTYILATGGTWRWQMRLPVDDRRHEVFWRQFLGALVASAPQRTALSARGVGRNVHLRAAFRDEGFQPLRETEVSVVMSHEDGEVITAGLLPSTTEPGVYESETTLTQAGMWYFEALARRGEETQAVARSSYYAEAEQTEHFNIRRMDSVLQGLSVATGGQHFSALRIDGLDQALKYASAGITQQQRHSLWDIPVVFLLLLLLKTGEWLLRRRWSSI